MEIILRQAVENLGKPGDVVTVKNGYARNFLLPRGFAYEATPGNLKRIAAERGRLEAAENERRETASELAKRLEEVQLSFSAPSPRRTSPSSSRRRASPSSAA